MAFPFFIWMIFLQAKRIWRDDRGDPVPVEKAQEVTDRIIEGGIKALWNFTPFRIRVPEHIVVQNTSMLRI